MTCIVGKILYIASNLTIILYMPNIIEIGQLWNDESEFFRDELYEAISENGVDWIPGQELFQSIHLAELSRNYLAVLRSVAERA